MSADAQTPCIDGRNCRREQCPLNHSWDDPGIRTVMSGGRIQRMNAIDALAAAQEDIWPEFLKKEQARRPEYAETARQALRRDTPRLLRSLTARGYIVLPIDLGKALDDWCRTLAFRKGPIDSADQRLYDEWMAEKP